jgi:hypothetical protein
VVPRENTAPKFLVDLVVEIRPAERHGHPGGPNMSEAARQPADTLFP